MRLATFGFPFTYPHTTIQMTHFIRKAGFLVCSLVALSASAQEFKPFKVNISLGYARPSEGSGSGGVLASLEPKYGINDQIDLGLRLETALVASSYNITGTGNNTNGTADVKALGSYLLTGTYLFSTNNFRPYLGAGAGLYNVAATSVQITNGSVGQNVGVEAAAKAGVMVRAGFKASHFNLGVEYNIVGNTTGISTQGQSYVGRNNYLGIKAGIDIGGGRR